MVGPRFSQSASVSPCAWHLAAPLRSTRKAPVCQPCSAYNGWTVRVPVIIAAMAMEKDNAQRWVCIVLCHMAAECCNVSAMVWEQQPLLHEHAAGAAPRSKGLLRLPPPVHKDMRVCQAHVPQIVGEACVLLVARNDNVDGACW